MVCKNVVTVIFLHFFVFLLLIVFSFIYFIFLFFHSLLEKEKVVIEEVKDEELNCAKERERLLEAKLEELRVETTQKGDPHFY